LEHKEHVELECRHELAASNHALERAAHELSALNEELRARSLLEAPRLQHVRVEYLRRAIAAQQAVVQTLRREAETSRLRWREAATKKLALEKLRSRQHRAHALAAERAEQLELEESNRP